MIDTKELSRLLTIRDAADPKTPLWHFQNNILKDALGEAAPEILDRLNRLDKIESLEALIP